MLEVVGLASLGDLHARTVPGAILLTAALNLPPPVDQAAMLARTSRPNRSGRHALTRSKICNVWFVPKKDVRLYG
jgi:glycine cleavage system pyridoxal-binding protein P